MGIVGRLPPHAGRAGRASDCSSPFLGPIAQVSCRERYVVRIEARAKRSFFLVFYPVARQQSREMAVSGLEGTTPQNGMR